MREDMLEWLKSPKMKFFLKRDKEVIETFINVFFDKYQPERLNPGARKGCDSLNSMET